MTPQAYLNQAGTSWPKAPGVADAVRDALAVDPSQYGALFVDARARIATSVGITDPEALLLTPGCTSALSTVLLGLAWEPGDVVVTSAVEHRAMLAPLETLARLRGVEVRTVDYRPGDPFDLAQLARLLDAERVRAVAVTAASNVTGELLPVEAITAAARQADVFCLVDAAQTAGLVHLDLEGLGADAVAFAGHKGPLAPQGIGGLWVRPGTPFAVPPGFCELGSVNLPAAAAMATSLEWLLANAPRRERAIALRRRLFEALRSRPDCHVFGGDGPSTSALSFLSDTIDVADAQAHFEARGVTLRAGRHCAATALHMLGVPQGTIRPSFGVFNDQEDLDALLAAL